MIFELCFVGALGFVLKALRSSDGPSAPFGAEPLPRRRVTGQGTLPAPLSDSMDGRELAASLPPKGTAARDAMVLAYADSGQISTPDLTAVTYVKDGHSVEIFPAIDAVKLGTVNPVRLTMRHLTAQALADAFGMVLPTTLMSDQAWLAATQIQPSTGLSGNAAADTATMVTQSDRVDALVAASGANGRLVRPVSKEWVNTERLMNADGSTAKSIDDKTNDAVANFGWHQKGAKSRSPGGQPVIQSVGLVHDLPFQDYSQGVCLFGPTCIIDGGEPEFIVDVLRDPARAYLLSDEVPRGRAARVVRHPDAPPNTNVLNA